MKNYLTLSKAKDLKDPKQRAIYRFLEILPGFLSWFTLFGVFLLSWLSPATAAVFIILFDFYWLLKISYLSFHQIASFKKMKENLTADWMKKLSQIKEWEQVYHLIILPFYKEKKEIIESSCQAIADCKYPKHKMMVVLAVEERAGKKARETAEELEKKFSSKFFRFLVTTHPENLPNEVAGKGSNTAWAIKQAKQKIIEPFQIKKDNILVSTFDIDTKPYPQYFSCLTYHYLTIENSKHHSYQPIPIYNNNVWTAPAFSRVIAMSGTFWQMMQQERPEILVTYSSHSTPFTVLDEVGYPKNVVSDDSRIFWKAYLFYDGNYKVLPLHYPVSMDAVLAENLGKTIINQYKQQRRWAWGCNDIPFMLFGFLKNKRIALSRKISYSISMLDGFWSWATASFLIFFLGWLPLIVGGEKFNITLLSYNLPRTTANLMRISMIGMIVSSIISLLILPPKPKKIGKLKNLSIVLQWLLLPLTLIIFGGIPSLDAQSRLMFEKYLGFWTTEKVR